MKEKLISVVIPTHNRAGLLPDVLDSVFAQKNVHFEVVIVNDASTDETEEVLSDYASRHTNLRVITTESPSGAPGARNIGWKVARGEYIAFNDDDILWHPEKLYWQLQKAEENRGAGLIYCKHAIWDGEWDVGGEPGAAMGERGAVGILTRNYIGTYTFFLPKKVLEEFKGFDESFPRFQDWELALRIGGRYQFAFVDKVLAAGKIVSGGISTQTEALERAADLLFRTGQNVLGEDEQALAELSYGIAKFLLGGAVEARGKMYMRKAVALQPGAPKFWLGYLIALGGGRLLRLLRRLRRAGGRRDVPSWAVRYVENMRG